MTLDQFMDIFTIREPVETISLRSQTSYDLILQLVLTMNRTRWFETCQ